MSRSRSDAAGLSVPAREDIVNTQAYNDFCGAQKELLQIFENQSNKVYKEAFEKLVNELKNKVINLKLCKVTLILMLIRHLAIKSV